MQNRSNKYINIKEVIENVIRVLNTQGLESINSVGAEFWIPVIDYVFIRLRALGLLETEAEELTSNVLLKFIKEIKKRYSNNGNRQFRGALHMLRWLNQVIQNEFRNHRKRVWYKRVLFFSNLTSKNKESDLPPEEFIEFLAKEDSNIAKTRAEQVWRIIHKDFNNTTRQILLLRFYWGLSYKEIADIVGKKEVNIRKIVSRAIQKIRNILGVTT